MTCTCIFCSYCNNEELRLAGTGTTAMRKLCPLALWAGTASRCGCRCQHRSPCPRSRVPLVPGPRTATAPACLPGNNWAVFVEGVMGSRYAHHTPWAVEGCCPLPSLGRPDSGLRGPEGCLDEGLWYRVKPSQLRKEQLLPWKRTYKTKLKELKKNHSCPL